jgi:hypothetical protein
MGKDKRAGKSVLMPSIEDEKTFQQGPNFLLMLLLFLKYHLVFFLAYHYLVFS